MPVTRGFQTLVDEALSQVQTRTASEVLSLSQDARYQLVDVRDVRELRGGVIPGSVHAPRCMLEFWVDPASPYHKPMWADESRHFILYCAAGWRSALATKTLQDMGLRNVSHLGGGYAAWVEAGGPTEIAETRRPKEPH
jgi:rhodanese-related sulfurtransferase